MEQILVTKVNGSTYLLEDRNAFRIIQSINQKVELRSNDVIDVNLESREFFSFTIGDSFTYFGKKYTLNQIPKVDKVHSNLFRYSITFEGVQFDLRRASYDVNIDTTGSAIYGETLTANLELFLRVLIENANRVFPGKWALGAFPSETETKTLTFSEEENCLSVLQTLCNEYDYDFTIKTENGVNILNILQVGQEIALEFKVGFQQGLYNLSRDKVDSNDIVTRLKVYGSSQNLGTDYRSNRLVLAGKNKPNSYIDSTAGITKYGIYEQTKIFEDIYPRRKGKVTAVSSDSVLKFSDSSMDFDLNERISNGTKYLLDGVSAKIHFNTGNLAGYEFELNENTGYNHTTKEFTIKKFTDENDYTFPATDNNVFRIGVNDEYVILDIKMPQSYIDNAEAELLEKGTEFLADKQEPLVQYTLDIDTLFLQRALNDTVNEFFQIGDFVKVIDADLELNRYIRIKAIERNLNNPFDYKLTLSDAKVTASLSNSIISDINTINNIIRINNLNDPARAKRNWKDAQEVLDMVFDVEGDYYTEKIKPNSIETMHLQVGAKSMQFNLVDSRFEPNLNGNPNLIQWSACKLIHFTIEETIKEWQITAGNKTLEANKPYYIYARCNKNNNIGVIEITETQYKVDAENYYYFLIGILNSYDSTILAREISLMYGFSTISGRFIKTGRIQSADGGTYFDLDSGEFKGRFTFSNGQNVEDAIVNQEISIEYSVNGTSNWHSTFTNGDLYMRQKKGNGAWSNAIRIVGERGANGNEGRYIDYQFAKNTSSTTAPTTDWQDAPPAISDSEFLWMRSGEVIPPATSPTSWSTPTRLSGVKGEQGIQGPQGPQGQAQFIHVRYSANSNGSSMTTTPTATTAYIGIANTTSSTAPTVNTAYTWSKFRGDDGSQGVQGIQGPAGANGQSLYTWVKYADTPNSGMSDYPDGKMYIGLAYNKTTEIESSIYLDYTWSLMPQNIEIGGRNLILKSDIGIDNSNSSQTYLFKSYDVSETLVLGEKYTFYFEVETYKDYTAQIVFVNNKTSVDETGINAIRNFNTENTSGVKKMSVTITANKRDVNELFYINVYNYNYGSTEAQRSNNKFILKKIALYKGDKATDWTPAPEDVQSAIDTAQTSANTANANLANYASDNVLTALEKKSVQTEWNRIKAEYSNAITSANSLLVSTTSLTTAYNTLNSYITPLLADLNSNSTIVGTTFRANFKNFYDANTTLLQAISLKLQSNIDSIEVGGRNYSSYFTKPLLDDASDNVTISDVTYRSFKAVFTKTATNTPYVFLPVLYSYELNKVYTLSFWIKATSEVTATSRTIIFGVRNSGSSDVSVNVAVGSWIKVSQQFALKSYSDSSKVIIFTREYADGITYEIKDVKLEQGNKSTDWSPAPEDVNSAISTAQDSANTANQVLSNIASDNVLTPSEKMQVTNEWNRIKAEYSATVSQATSVSVTYSDLTTKYNTLNSYITPLLASVTSNSTIVGATFRTNFNNYYSAVSSVLQAVSIKLQSNIDSANTAITNAQNSANTANNLLTQIASDSYLTASEKQQVSNEWNRIKSEYINNLALANSLSVSATSYTSNYNTLNTYITPLLASLTTTSAIVGATFRTNFSNYYTANIELLKNISLKLQSNNQANTNAIAETNAELSRAQSAIDKANAVTSFLETTVDGNVISTGMLQVGDKNQANAGISGLKEGGSNSIRFWAGDKSDNRKVAPFRVQDDGKVFMTNAYVQGEVYATSGTFSGTVRATEGYIGGFEIKDNILKAGSNVAGVWFDSVKDNSFTSVKVGNYIGDGIPTWNHQGNNLFPVISIEGNDTDNLNLFRAGVYINLNLPDNSIVSKPAIQIDNGHISGIALPINSYIHNETINTNADVAVFNTNGSNFNNVLYLPDTPRIGKVLTIMNVDSGASSLSIRSRNHNIGKGRYGASNSYSLSKSGTFIFIGNIWILISEAT